MSSFEEYLYNIFGASSGVRKAYRRVFNNTNKESTDGKAILNDLMMKFRFYGAKQTNDPIELAKQSARREVIEYILAMSVRLSDDTLSQVEQFINH